MIVYGKQAFSIFCVTIARVSGISHVIVLTYKKNFLFLKANLHVFDRFPLNSSSTASINGSAYLENDKSMSTILNNTTCTITAGSTLSNGKSHPNNATFTTLTANQSIYVPQIKSKHSGEYMGILEWKTEEENKIIAKLMEELKPRLAVTFLPGLPAYALFMCIRYADMLNDDERVRSLLNSSVQAVKRLIKKKQEDLEYVVLWMTNFCRLIHNLKQYSGEAVRF